VIKLRAILGRRWLILLVTTACGIAAGFVSSSMAQTGDARVERSFTASQTIIANREAPGAVLVSQDVLRLTRGEVPKLAARKLKSKVPPEKLAAKINTIFDGPSAAITVSSDSTSVKEAEARVKAFVDAFVEVTSANANAGRAVTAKAEAAELQSAIDALNAFDQENPDIIAPGFISDGSVSAVTRIQQRNNLLNAVESLKARNRQSEANAISLSPYVSLGPNQTKPSASGLLNVPASAEVRAFLLGVLGLLLGGVVTMLLERMNRRIDTRDELTELINLPILAEIGYDRQKRRHQDEDGSLRLTGVWAEPYRRVRSAIQFVQASESMPNTHEGQPVEGHRAPQVFLVTSTSPGEGKSTSTALTALAMAEVGSPTLVVGGDFRKPMIDRLLGVDREPSVQDFAKLDIDRPSVDEVVHTTDHASLYVAPAGPATREVARLVEAAKELVEVACERGATVIIDSSPLQAANDTLDLLPVVDYVILVLRAGRSGETDLLDTIETMNRMGTRILGIILIGTPIGRKQSYYYDYYSPEGGGLPPEMPILYKPAPDAEPAAA